MFLNMMPTQREEMLEYTGYCQVPMCNLDKLYLLFVELNLIRNTFL